MTARLTPGVAALLVVPPLMWAGNAVVGRLVVPDVPPVLLNTLRWVLALLLLLPLGWQAVATPAARADIARRWRPLLLVGALGVGTYNALQYLALQTSTPINVTLIAASSPLWMLLVGAVMYRERPGRRALLGACLSLAGVLVVIARGDVALLAQVRFVAGDLWMLLAAASWAVYSWLLARPPEALGARRPPAWDWAGFLLVQTLFGIAWTGLWAGVEAVVAPQPVRWSPMLALALLYIAVGPSVLAYRCWGAGVAAVGPAIAAFFSNLTPLFAAMLSALVLGEAPHAYHAVAFALIVGGIVASMPRR